MSDRPSLRSGPAQRQRIRRARVGLGALALAALGGCGGATRAAAPTTSGVPPTTTITTITTTTPLPPTCPLTGTPVPGGAPVPARPALAVKVDNYPAARPQSGLDHADIVFEEPVEGGITRYVAVFQCQEAPLVGPIRSARNIDIGILGQFGLPLLVHVGGIDPVIADINASPLVNLDLGDFQQIIQNPPGRVAPYSTYASTAAMWALRPSDLSAPKPVFGYSTTQASGTPVGTVSIPFSFDSDVVWHVTPFGTFQRFYGTAPDTLAGGEPVTATNVVVQFVQVTYGPWYENSEGGLEVQANLYQNASGPAQVYRDGVQIVGTWHRSALSQPTQFLTPSGEQIRLRPGPTWVELVPSGIGVTTTPPAAATPPAAPAPATSPVP